ncbi:zinc carboxypeptidase [Lutibacter sp. HS1-25]|uniref:M14 family zinc carboxypeptidase n=1 Tax=Lutibacter sp. HS1-25 TaxID=2485000 RepID=UPI00101026FC|nr:M14 family zinc carboxypeptidase [Lutibacter sp. HS1-25]RXP61875.1 zinc carboxypeptidase [Lutibacter sp. HS1-25]
MKALDTNNLESWYASNFEKSLKGRRILFDDIQPIIEKLTAKFEKNILGYSESGIPIYKISIGSGHKKVLIWSQMHGNESTGTKAVFDLFKFIASNNIDNKEITTQILSNCTLEFIVLLNPDGAIKFTRENANNIDLNRDAVNRAAVESNLLRDTLDSFNPQFCFNLHDQRSIFNVEGTPNPATISFLAPSEDIDRTLTNGRKETMSVIVAMNELLQQLIPNQIGRYTDEFYPTATGDNFQKLGHNTILIEAGHFKDDYDRDITRKYNFYALLQGLLFIANNSTFSNYLPYFDIPNNDNKFLDIIYEDVSTGTEAENKLEDIGIQVKFKVENGKLISYEDIEQKGDLSNFYTYNRIKKDNLKFFDLKLSNS